MRGERLSRFGQGLAIASCLMAAAGSPTAAWAQCTDTIFNVVVSNGSTIIPAAQSFALGTGSAAGSLSSIMNSVNTAFLTTTSSFVTGGSGAWVRGVGGVTETKTNSVGTLDKGTSVPPVSTFDLSGSVNCKTTVKQEYSGFQIGADLSNVVMGNGRFNWGIMGGRLQTNSKDNTPASPFSNFAGTGVIPGGSIQIDTGVSFLGLYATYTQGGFFIDTQVRWDNYKLGANDFSNAQAPFTVSGNGFAVALNSGYNMPIGQGWFIEPSGGLVVSHTSFDPFFVNRGTGAPFINTGAGNISVDDITSVIGRATFRVGTNVPMGKTTLQPYFSYSLFHEFNGDVTVTSIANNGGTFNADGAILTTKSAGGVGTYNQFALGTAAILSASTTAYVRGDYKIGENIEGWGVSLGMRVNF